MLGVELLGRVDAVTPVLNEPLRAGPTLDTLCERSKPPPALLFACFSPNCAAKRLTLLAEAPPSRRGSNASEFAAGTGAPLPRPPSRVPWALGSTASAADEEDSASGMPRLRGCGQGCASGPASGADSGSAVLAADAEGTA